MLRNHTSTVAKLYVDLTFEDLLSLSFVLLPSSFVVLTKVGLSYLTSDWRGGIMVAIELNYLKKRPVAGYHEDTARQGNF